MIEPGLGRAIPAGCRAVAAAVCFGLLVSACAKEEKPRRQTEHNPKSLGYIDLPRPNEAVGPQFLVAGWAVDESGVKTVRIYLDDDLVASLPLVVNRPDVDQALPKFAAQGPLHGFGAAIDANSHVGYCTIRAEALDGKGALTRFAEVTVKIEP